MDQLHQRWVRRRGREVEWLKTERTTCEKLRRECAGMRDAWLKRRPRWNRSSAVSEKALALEQMQQEQLGQAADASAAGRRLEKLRRRWASLSAATEKSLAEQWQKLQTEAAPMEAMHKRLHKHTAKITGQETELGQRLSEWERSQLAAADEMNQLRQELSSANALRDRYEKQATELREVEQLARLFLDETEPLRLPNGGLIRHSRPWLAALLSFVVRAPGITTPACPRRRPGYSSGSWSAFCSRSGPRCRSPAGAPCCSCSSFNSRRSSVPLARCGGRRGGPITPVTDGAGHQPPR